MGRGHTSSDTSGVPGRRRRRRQVLQRADRGTRAPVFFTLGGAAFKIPSVNVFNEMRYDWGNVETLPDSEVMSFSGIPADGTVFFESHLPQDDEEYFIVGGAKLRITPDPGNDLSGHVGGFYIRALDEAGEINAGRVWSGALGSIPNTPRDGTLLREQSSAPVYVMMGGKKCHISSPARFDQLCFFWENVRVVPDGSHESCPGFGAVGVFGMLPSTDLGSESRDQAR